MPQRRRKARPGRGRTDGPSPQEALAKALKHPIRVKVLTILTERIASPSEIAKQIELPLGNISYHIKVLSELGFIEIKKEEKVRGSIAHFYKAVDRPLIDNTGWASLNSAVRRTASSHLLESLISDAAQSLSADVFDKRPERHLSRTPLFLDEAGWLAVLKIQGAAVEAILKEQAAAAARLAGSPAEIQAILAVMCFEAASGKDR